MKKYILTIISLLLIACGKDEQPLKEAEFFGDLKPAEIIIKQGDNILQNASTENKIILEQGQDYHISVVFKEEVSLQNGDFLKMKAKNKKEFFADFYGKNLNEINEKVTFKKEGYNDFVLEITQKSVVPNKYTRIQSYGMANVVSSDKDSKTIWVINTDSSDNEINFLAEFLAPVFFENDPQKGLEVEKESGGEQYQFTFPNTKILEGEDFLIPIYSLVNDEKGEKIGDLVVKADNKLYTMVNNGWNNTLPSDSFDYTNYWGNEASMEIYIQSEKTFVVIENINNEIIETAEAGRDNSKKGVVDMIFKDDLSKYNEKTIRAFDAYEAELINGELVKKANAKKHEFFATIYIY